MTKLFTQLQQKTMRERGEIEKERQQSRWRRKR
jgi:hypothetical protein